MYLLMHTKAAARLKDLRESTADALAEIPTLLSNTQSILGAFKSKKLHECSSKLFVSTLCALEHIIAYYKKKAASKMHSNLGI